MTDGRGPIIDLDAGRYRAVIRDGVPLIEREDDEFAAPGVLVRCSPEVYASLSDEWSGPVVWRIEDGEFVFATVDPRRPGGDISGPGGPFDASSVVIDTTNAVVLEGVEVAAVDRADGEAPGPAAEPILALLLRGRINRTTERAQVLYLVNEDGAAAVITQLIGVADRAGFGQEFVDCVVERLADMPKEPRS